LHEEKRIIVCRTPRMSLQIVSKSPIAYRDHRSI
jgi:hypothetical protein